MPRGFSAVAAAAADVEARKNKQNDGNYTRRRYLRIEPGETVKVRFLEQGDEVFSAWCHQLEPSEGRSWGAWTPCIDQDPETGDRVGKDCPGCERDLRRSFRIYLNVIWRDAPVLEVDEDGKYVRDSKGNYSVVGNEDQIALWDQGIIVSEDLQILDADYEGLRSQDFKIRRIGQGKNTRYSILPTGESTPLSKADKELETEKYDLNELVTPDPYETWGKRGSQGKTEVPRTAPVDVSPFRKRS